MGMSGKRWYTVGREGENPVVRSVLAKSKHPGSSGMQILQWNSCKTNSS